MYTESIPSPEMDGDDHPNFKHLECYRILFTNSLFSPDDCILTLSFFSVNNTPLPQSFLLLQPLGKAYLFDLPKLSQIPFCPSNANCHTPQYFSPAILSLYPNQWFPTFLAPGTGSVEENSGTGSVEERWFQNGSSTLHLLCTLFLT